MAKKREEAVLESFIKLCGFTQNELKKYVADKLTETHTDVICSDGYVFAKGSFPVMLVAHLDTVHKDLPSEVIAYDSLGVITSPQGIGGDDRCGVYMIFQILKDYNCSVLFCEDEEKHGVGSGKFVASEDGETVKACNFNYIIEFDRKGSTDAVFYKCDNQEFADFITSDYYVKSKGTFTDICVLCPHFDRAGVNLSCGYYRAHRTDEYVVWSDMQRSIKEACRILARTDKKDIFYFK